MAWTVSIKLPPDMLMTGDRRQNFRNVVFGRMRRAMQQVAEKAAGATAYPPAKRGYKVQQTTGPSLEIDILNEAPAFGYTQNYHGKQPPSAPGTRLHAWAFERGLPAFPVARQLAAWGKLDTGVFAYVWNSAEPELERIAAQAASDFCEHWGNLSV